ncbi:hypothetical protein [Alteromonas facilis]|uniref:hypothetical protein n=1 Tax=Alteromonas facilis TaxID=2048004 RepID=UPI000C2898D6|nr:hypothetical protein [Alteromonas facilis]
MYVLNENECEAINGAGWQYLAGWAVGHALDYAINTYVDSWQSAVENGWGSNPVGPAGNSAGFGTI